MKRDARSVFESAMLGVKDNQEVIAERLCLSKRAFQRYLYGEQYPPCEVIAKAVTEYSLHALAIHHLNNVCPVCRAYMKNITEYELAQSVLVFQKQLTDIQCQQDRLIAIACDNKISDEERKDWSRIVDDIREVVGSLVALVAAGERRTL